jgi:hypothetical protein
MRQFCLSVLAAALLGLCLGVSEQGSAIAQAAAPAPAAPPAPAVPDSLSVTIVGNPPSVTLGNGGQATVSLGTSVAFTIKAVEGSSPAADATNSDTLTVTSSDPAASPKSQTLTLSGGAGTVSLTFGTPGSWVVTATDASTKNSYTSPAIVVNSTVAGCSSCFASIGAGAVVTGVYGDYNDTNNVLEATHIGVATPQYLVGVAYRLPIPGEFYKLRRLGCSPSAFTSPQSDGTAAYCYPFKAFINLKFTPDASQTFNGFTYGISHALHKDLDILLGWSFSAFNQVSPGFQAAAINVVKAAQPGGSSPNQCYAQWTVAGLSATGATTFDGFPTQLLSYTGSTTSSATGSSSSPICTPGAQIYDGSPLVEHYHSGLFVGIAVPISFKTLFQ